MVIEEYPYVGMDYHGVPEMPDLSDRRGDQLVCIHDVFMFIFIHSVIELVGILYDDICGLLVSLFVYTNIGPRPSPRNQRWVVTIAPVAVPIGSSCRQWWEMDGVLPHLEWLATGVLDDGWQHLSSDMIAAIHNLPSKLTGVMRKMVMDCEHFL